MEYSVRYTPFFILICVLIVSLVVGLMSRRQDKGGYGLQVRSIGHANIGAAIQNARLYQETQRRAEEMAAVVAEFARSGLVNMVGCC